MKRQYLLVPCSILIVAVGSGAADLPTLESGQKLFTSTQLGTSGTSCATCHPDGKNLEGAATAGDDELATTVNACITGPLKGHKLDPESSDMKSLVLYLKSIAGSGK